jgi:sec-independent protein translocase protein TatC
MPVESEETRPEVEEEEDGGGAVKSFLDHLEDLRWTIIKAGAAVFVGMVICLSAGNVLMNFITWPLDRLGGPDAGKKQYVAIEVGTNRLATIQTTTNRFGTFDLGTNQFTTFRMIPRLEGTNLVTGLEVVTNDVHGFFPKRKTKLLNLTPAGGFFVAFQLAVYGGIVLGSPFIIYFTAQFILPALKRKEKKYLYRGFLVGTGLFLTGVGFCYLVLMPLALNASRMYSNWLGIEADQWTAEAFISFECKFMLGMGLGFEMPVILLVLVKLGILDYHKLAAFRRYMIVINLVLGAVLTTPEVLTQVMMALPLQLLYEITVWIAWYWERRDRKREAALNAAGTPPD